MKSVCEPLVAALFLSGEQPLTSPLKGTSRFAEQYAAQGPRDSKGRSLRQLELKTRLFTLRCSPLVHSPALAALPTVGREYIARRFDEILSGRDNSPTFAHLTPADRMALREHLNETHRWRIQPQ